MNKLTLAFLASIIFATGVMSAEYRKFINQEGATIVARVLNYEVKSERVELQLKNNKKAWVELSTLSEGDQAYIKKLYSEENVSKVKETVTNISEEEVEALAKLYIKALEEHDFELWRSLILPLHGKHVQPRFEEITMKVKRVDGLNVQIKIRSEAYSRTTGWLQVTPMGQIKYTPLQFRHPCVRLIDACGSLYAVAKEGVDGTYRDPVAIRVLAYESLKQSNIPTYGYNPTASESERRSRAMKIEAWMKTHMTTWDDSEPKLAMPEKEFEELFDEVSEKH